VSDGNHAFGGEPRRGRVKTMARKAIPEPVIMVLRPNETRVILSKRVVCISHEDGAVREYARGRLDPRDGKKALAFLKG